MVGDIARSGTDALPSEEPTKQIETVEQACGRVTEQRKTDGRVDATREGARLKRYAYPEIGHLGVTTVRVRHVNAVLDVAKEAGKSKGTVQHLRQDLANVFAVPVREGALTTNPADDAVLPQFSAEVTKERAVLTDDELVAYLQWVHPDKRYQKSAGERQTMACVSRMFGGLRTGDLHTLKWEAFDLSDDGAFAWGWAPRRKTKRPQRLPVPEPLRPVLKAWWVLQKRPRGGLVFPTRKGKRAGDVRVAGESHAREFRRDLRRAFGIDRWDPEAKTWKEDARPLTRRAFAQALADAEVNAQTAMTLTGHSSMAVHQRYLANAAKVVTVPESALPKMLPSFVPNSGRNSEDSDHDPAEFSVSRDRIELSTRGVPAPRGVSIEEHRGKGRRRRAV